MEAKNTDETLARERGRGDVTGKHNIRTRQKCVYTEWSP